jgi:hypothetical protein
MAQYGACIDTSKFYRPISPFTLDEVLPTQAVLAAIPIVTRNHREIKVPTSTSRLEFETPGMRLIPCNFGIPRLHTVDDWLLDSSRDF